MLQVKLYVQKTHQVKLPLLSQIKRDCVWTKSRPSKKTNYPLHKMREDVMSKNEMKEDAVSFGSLKWLDGTSRFLKLPCKFFFYIHSNEIEANSITSMFC